MSTDDWHVRIDDADGGANGTGLLVGARQVLTCAHVVRDIATPVVSFPTLADLRNLPARVAFPGPYNPDSGRGDVAVLELEADVPVSPARFARPGALGLRPQTRLVSYGFPPYGYDADGVLAEARADNYPRIGGEWCQLESWSGHGMRLVGGFSGAAVAFADTREVVGIVVATDEDESTRLARMLPVDRIARYWPAITDLLPLGPFDVDATGELRALLADLVLPHPAQAYARALPPDRLRAELPPDTRTAYEVAVALVGLMYGDGDAGIRRAVAALCAHLAASVPGLQAWLDRTIPEARAPRSAPVAGPAAPGPPPSAPPERACVIVEMAPSGSERGAFLLTVWRLVGDEITCPESVTVTGRELRRTVERVVPDVVNSIERTDLPLRVEFVLPRQLLTKPVHGWTAQADGGLTFGLKHAMVLRDRARFVARTPDRDLRRRWELLCAKAGSPDLRWIDCTDDRDRQRLIGWLAGDREATAVALPAPPRPPDRHPGLAAAFASNVPVVLWGGEVCPNGGRCPQPCNGQRWRDAVDATLADCPPGDLPERLLDLRLAAAASGQDWHCGRELMLLWDDPNGRPAADVRLGLAG